MFTLIVAAVCVASAKQQRLNDAEQSLVGGSKAAILDAGITEAYFDTHFTLSKVFNTPGDRRVLWRFSVNGHETLVSDTIGFYTEGGKRVDTHSIAGTLGAAHDITRTITRRRAEAVMRSCIGRFDAGTVVLIPLGMPSRASLVFTATSLPRRKSHAEREREERERERRERRERAEREQARPGGVAVMQQTDTVEEEDEGGDEPIYIGSVDLETGRCTKGRALSGPETPERRPR